MPRTAKFDHVEACRLYYEEGLSGARIAAMMGVSETRVHQVVNPEQGERAARLAREYQQSGVCQKCGAQCQYNPSMNTRRGLPRDHQRCRKCWALDQRFSGDVKVCGDCERELPVSEFWMRKRPDGSKYPYPLCKECEVGRRRWHRERNPEASRAYDREYKKRRRDGVA